MRRTSPRSSRCREAEKARLDEEAAAAEAARLAEYNSPEARAARVRREGSSSGGLRLGHRTAQGSARQRGRLQRLRMNSIRLGRRTARPLRDLPEQPGFPWLGGGEG